MHELLDRRGVALAVLFTGLALAACGGEGGPLAATPTAPPPTPGPTATITPTAVVTAEAKAVALGERVTFYGADPDDHAAGHHQRSDHLVDPSEGVIEPARSKGSPQGRPVEPDSRTRIDRPKGPAQELSR